jgi:hypothetical protein
MTDDAAWADDGEEYDDVPEEAAPGLAVTALAGATGAVVGFAAGGPVGAAVGGGATPFLAIVFQKTVNAIWSDRARRADKMLETAADTAGLAPEQFAERAGETEQTRFLTDKAIQAAADTIWPAGVRAIGRAYAAGLLAQDKPVLDIRLRVLGIMQDLDELHVRLLDLLVRYEPDVRNHEYVAVRQRFPSYVNKFMGGDRPDNPKIWSVGRRKWTTRQISAVMPEIDQVLGSLLGELRESGLVRENDTAPDAAKSLGEDLARQVNRQADRMQRGRQTRPITLQQSAIRAAEPTWSPTKLGEKILGFYAEAGAEDSGSGLTQLPAAGRTTRTCYEGRNHPRTGLDG